MGIDEKMIKRQVKREEELRNGIIYTGSAMEELMKCIEFMEKAAAEMRNQPEEFPAQSYAEDFKNLFKTLKKDLMGWQTSQRELAKAIGEMRNDSGCAVDPGR